MPQVSPELIGRDDVLDLARRRLAAAGAGSGQLLLLAGEAGIGKSRMLSEIEKLSAAAHFTVVRAAAFPWQTDVAGGVIADLGADLRRAAATAAAGRGLAELLEDGGPHRPGRLPTSQLADAVLSLTEPTLIALEDLHWADHFTLEVLDRMARRLVDRPILVVATYRTDELHRLSPIRAWRSRLTTQRLAEEVRLGRMTAADTAALVAAISQTPLPAATVAAVFDRSDGIPLHIEEFLAVLADPPVGVDPWHVIPESLSEVVVSRAQQLSPAARALADAAAVIGRSFDLDLLTTVTGDSAAAIDDGLRELGDSFLVQPNSDGVSFDFRHALIRDALYAELSPLRRRALHATIAAAAIGRSYDDAVISDHYEHAHLAAEAHRHAVVAAAAAARLSAHREAVALYRRAERTLPTSVDPAERADLAASLGAELAAVDDNAAAATAYATAFDTRLALGDRVGAAALQPAVVAVQHLLGVDLEHRVRLLRDALELLGAGAGAGAEVRARLHAALAAAYMLDRRLEAAIEAGQQARELATAVDDPGLRSNIDATLGAVLVFAGRMDEGWGLLRAAINAALAAGSDAEAARGYRMLATSASVVVEYPLATRWLTEGIEYAHRTERFNDRHYMAAHLAHVHWATGDLAAANSEAAAALADGRGGITTRIIALHVLGYLQLTAGRWAEADRLLTEAAELGGAMRELQRLSPAWWGLAESALRSGRPAVAADWCERGLAASLAVRDAAYLFPFVLTGVRAQLALPAGDARGWFDRCAELLRERGIPGAMGALIHAEGVLELRVGRLGAAGALLTEAVEFWAARGRFWEHLQALLDSARCAVRSRQFAAAATLADDARVLANRVGAAAFRDELDALQAEVRPTRAGSASPLTVREAEIARLVGEGATNRQIAVALFISPKTVAAHVEHILAKLGANRRAQIATWVARGAGDENRTRVISLED